MRFPRSLALLLAAGIVAPALRADALSDVRGALQRLAGREPLHAVVTLERSRHSQGRFVNDDFDGSASFRVTLDATSMNVTYERALLSPAAAGRQDGGQKGQGEVPGMFGRFRG